MELELVIEIVKICKAFFEKSSCYSNNLDMYYPKGPFFESHLIYRKPKGIYRKR